LPLVRLPHEWHEDQRRPACVKRSNPVKGQKFPATPVFGDNADRILDALFTPGVDDVGKWAKRWGHHKLRNRTIMEVGRGTGARIHEILLLRPSDIDFDARQVVVRRGKGGKRRLIAILPSALEALERWLPVWAAQGFKDDDLLFPVLEGATKGGPMDQAYVRDRLHAAARKAGVNVRAAPHQWRHGLAVELHRRKVPIGIIQRQLGHSSPATTGIYLAGISAEEVIDAVVAAFDE
jgi:integrase